MKPSLGSAFQDSERTWGCLRVTELVRAVHGLSHKVTGQYHETIALEHFIWYLFGEGAICLLLVLFFYGVME